LGTIRKLVCVYVLVQFSQSIGAGSSLPFLSHPEMEGCEGIEEYGLHFTGADKKGYWVTG
jgi:hypothetical protein